MGPAATTTATPQFRRDRIVACLTAIMLLMSIVSTYAVVAAALGAGKEISAFHLVVGLLLGAGLTGVAATRWPGCSPRVDLLWTSALVTAISAGSVFLALRFYDVSSDGQEYHQTAIWMLVEGWNPNERLITIDDSLHHRWLNHYPKAAWYVHAALLKATGQIEAAKATNLMLAAAAALFIYAAAVAYVRRWQAATLSMLATVNAVALCQLFSFYIDGQLASVWLATIALAFLWARTPSWTIEVAVVGCFSYMAGLKFTGLLFALVIAVAAQLSIFLRARPLARRWAVVSTVGLFTATLLVGYNPYVTNTLRRGNPLYLLIGDGAVDYVSDRGPGGCCVPPGFNDINRFRALAISLVSPSDNNWGWGHGPIRYKLPFTVDSREVEAFFLPDVRLGGWGPLMSGAVLIALVALVLGSRSAAVERPRVTLDLLSLQLAAIALLPYSWWARYAPMIAFVPVVVLADLWVFGNRRSARFLSIALVTTLALNCLLVAQSYLTHQLEATRLVHTQLIALARLATPIEVQLGSTESVRYRLRASGVAFREVADLKCVPQQVMHSETRFCLPP